jgi:hypothetical protein
MYGYMVLIKRYYSPKTGLFFIRVYLAETRRCKSTLIAYNVLAISHNQRLRLLQEITWAESKLDF